MGAIRLFAAAACLALAWSLAGQETAPAPPKPAPQAAPPAKSTTPPSREDLDRITARGRKLADYDRVMRAAVDAVLDARCLKNGDSPTVLGIERAGAWTFYFGSLGEGPAFLVRAEAVRAGADQPFLARAVEPPRAESGELLQMARAAQVALKDAGELEGPYTLATLSDGALGFWVYLYPTPIDPNGFPVGPDWRYHITASGEVVEKRQLHKGRVVTPLFYNPWSDDKTQVTIHFAVLDSRPEDTDVAAALLRWPKVPDLMGADPFLYGISPDGTLAYLGTIEAFLKTSKGGKK